MASEEDLDADSQQGGVCFPLRAVSHISGYADFFLELWKAVSRLWNLFSCFEVCAYHKAHSWKEVKCLQIDVRLDENILLLFIQSIKNITK